MQNGRILKIIGILLALTLLIILCITFINFNKAVEEDAVTPVIITPPVEKKVAPAQNFEKIEPATEVKPVTRDENNVPKSDYKVPEIG